MSNRLEQLAEHLINGEEEQTVLLVNQLVKEEIDVNDIIEKGLSKGIRKVGDLFEEGEYFLPELMYSAEIMKVAMDILEPLLVGEEKSHRKGKVVIGTVSGDIHDIGKTLVGSMLTASGFEVRDLGSDVSVNNFISSIKEFNPDLLCLSALLTTTMMVQEEVINRIRKEGIRESIKIMVGGAPVSSEFASKIGADGYADNAVEAVKIATQLLKK